MNKAIFLDRDGTINKEVDYLTKIEQVVLIRGAKKALQTFRKLGFLNIVITNQSAVARGYLTEKKLFEIHSKFLELLTHKTECLVEDIFYCPFHKEGIVKEYSKDSFNRKPNPGLILKAAIRYNIDLHQSFLVGDSFTDMKCAENSGLKKILVLTGYGKEALEQCKEEKLKLDFVVNDLLDASKIIKKYLDN